MVKAKENTALQSPTKMKISVGLKEAAINTKKAYKLKEPLSMPKRFEKIQSSKIKEDDLVKSDLLGKAKLTDAKRMKIKEILKMTETQHSKFMETHAKPDSSKSSVREGNTVYSRPLTKRAENEDKGKLVKKNNLIASVKNKTSEAFRIKTPEKFFISSIKLKTKKIEPNNGLQTSKIVDSRPVSKKQSIETYPVIKRDLHSPITSTKMLFKPSPRVVHQKNTSSIESNMLKTKTIMEIEDSFVHNEKGHKKPYEYLADSLSDYIKNCILVIRQRKTQKLPTELN